MGRRWIRLDVGWDDSDWLAALKPEEQLAWIKLLCYTKLAGHGGRVDALGTFAAGKKWGVAPRAVATMLDAAKRDAALHVEGDEWVIVNWSTYQQPDLTAAERKRRQRRDSVPHVTA